jgi:toxin ParE1/3/4
MAEHEPAIIWSPEALDDIDRLWDTYVQVAGRVTARSRLLPKLSSID